ncbi:MAG: glycosyltransferase family 39 protein [Candidatus Bathyarchaeota archaeon]|nr:glycosyltransferase family 39 protein [Candidatus Bathyarchaeota archaeon]
MYVNKQDLLSIAALCVIFFSVAAWNLGEMQVPLTAWQVNGSQTFYIDLGEAQSVGTVYMLVKNGSATVQVYTGSPGSWSLRSNLSLKYPFAYYDWNKIEVNSETRYVRFKFEQASAEILELAVLGQANQKLSIAAINGEGAIDEDLQKLVDEQALVQVPPTYMSETYFDEVYFARTAENYLRLQYPYEWTHPPLGKLIQAAGIALFGYSPFGWRIMGVIAATLMIPVLYMLGKTLFESWIGGFAAAFLLTFDFMHFTMARMGTADTYVVLFSLASQLFFLIYLKNVLKSGWSTSVKPLFWAVLFFALGFATKWIVLYGFAAQLAILAALRLREVAKLDKGLTGKLYAFTDPPFATVVAFLLLAILVYFLTYIPDILAGRSIVNVLGVQGGMLNYHATLTASHPFSSPWWTWPLLLRPVWLYVSYLPLNVKSTIVLLGNPAVWWIGFACMIGIAIFAVDRFRKAAERRVHAVGLPALFILAFFFFQWLPYVLISRVTFLYHFYVNVPFLCLAAAYFISTYWSNRWVKVATMAYFACTVALFVLFYPVISGMPASTSFIDSLKWLNGWVF